MTSDKKDKTLQPLIYLLKHCPHCLDKTRTKRDKSLSSSSCFIPCRQVERTCFYIRMDGRIDEIFRERRPAGASRLLGFSDNVAVILQAIQNGLDIVSSFIRPAQSHHLPAVKFHKFLIPYDRQQLLPLDCNSIIRQNGIRSPCVGQVISASRFSCC